MSWLSSRFRAGDIVQVRTKDEILATLDRNGCIDGMPFMPEMLQYCGQHFRVGSVAHKTCDPIRKPWARRLNASVHLDGLRCDGSAHDGCQAECNLFWKDIWLTPVGKNTSSATKSMPGLNDQSSASDLESILLNNTRSFIDTEDGNTIYTCQATMLFKATKALAWWDIRQYILDVVTGNYSAGRVIRVLFLATLRWLLLYVPCGYRLFKRFHDWAHYRLTGRGSPSLNGQIPDRTPTPSGKLYLTSGEYVRIRTQQEIEQTVNKHGKNRGLGFDPEEMAPFCGRVVKVRKSVTKIVDEGTGKMLQMKEPCIMLEGVTCRGEYASFRLNCPRAIPSYWREIWLERVKNDESPATRDKDAGKA